MSSVNRESLTAYWSQLGGLSLTIHVFRITIHAHGRLSPHFVDQAEFAGRHRACDADLCCNSPGLSQGSTHLAGQASMGWSCRADPWGRSGLACGIHLQWVVLSSVPSSCRAIRSRCGPSRSLSERCHRVVQRLSLACGVCEWARGESLVLFEARPGSTIGDACGRSLPVGSQSCGGRGVWYT